MYISAQKNHVSDPRPHGCVGRDQVPKKKICFFFAKNHMKCTDLHRKIMLLILTPMVVG